MFWLPVLLAAALWLSLILQSLTVTLWWLPLAAATIIALNQTRRSPMRSLQAALPIVLLQIRQVLPILPTDWAWFETVGEPARNALANHLGGVSQSAAALVLGITDGDASRINTDLAQRLKELSLSHITAVSGTNCTILIATVLSLAGVLGLTRPLRVTLALITLAGYLLLVGEQPSVLRAAAMAVISLLAMLGGSRKSNGSVLALGVVTLLLLRPDFATDLAFALSVAATCGVVFLAPGLQQNVAKVMPDWLALAVSVALSAQVACLPILVFIQGRLSLGGLLANLLAEPAIALITVLGFGAAVATLLSLPFGGGGGAPLFWLGSLPSQYVLAVADWLYTATPHIPVPSTPASFGFAALLLLGVVLLIRGKSRHSVMAFLVAGALAISFSFTLGGHGRYPVTNWFMVACDIGQGDATVLRGGGEIAVIDAGPDPNLVDRCLSRLGVREVTLLVLTHFDMDHVGGVAGVLHNREIGQVLLTQFQDSRVGASDIKRLLAKLGLVPRYVALGDSGVLGKPGRHGPEPLAWMVLNPRPDGADAVDPNDGSIAMYWQAKDHAIFTMADVPASGQARILQDLPVWWHQEWAGIPTILKLSHHGSADQDPAFLSWVHPLLATISVGAGNRYGHPTAKALGWLAVDAWKTLRTDRDGSIAIGVDQSGLAWATAGAL